MKTPVEIYYDKFLDLMEEAWNKLSLKEFEEVEDKIRSEIFNRRFNAIKKARDKKLNIIGAKSGNQTLRRTNRSRKSL